MSQSLVMNKGFVRVSFPTTSAPHQLTSGDLIIPRRHIALPGLVKCSSASVKSGCNGFPLLKGGKGTNYFHEVEFRVRDYELDRFGVVNNAVYSNYCQHAYRELLDSIDLNPDAIARTGIALAFSEVNLKYLAPLRAGDGFVVKVRVSHCSAARLFIEHIIFKLPNEEPILEAKSQQCGLIRSIVLYVSHQKFCRNSIRSLDVRSSSSDNCCKISAYTKTCAMLSCAIHIFCKCCNTDF